MSLVIPALTESPGFGSGSDLAKMLCGTFELGCAGLNSVVCGLNPRVNATLSAEISLCTVPMLLGTDKTLMVALVDRLE